MKYYSFPTAYLYEARFSSYSLIKEIYCNRSNAEADMRTQLFAIKLDIKEIFKNVKQWYSSH